MEPLADVRILLAGDDADALAGLRAWLAAAGASPAVCSAHPEDVTAVVAEDTPAAVLVLGGSAEAVRRRLDPLGLEAGPPVLPVGDVVAPGEAPGPAALRRLRAFAAVSALRARQAELEAVVAAQAVDRRREVDAA